MLTANSQEVTTLQSLVVVIPSLGMGGAERSLIKLVNLSETEFREIHVVSLTTADGRMVKEFVNPDRIKVHQLCAGSSANPWVWIRLWFLLRTLRPSTVLGWSTYANLCAIVAAWGLVNCRIVISERCYVPMLYGRRARGSWLGKRLVRFAMGLLYPRAHCITANSRLNVVFLRKYIGRGPDYQVLPNTIDLADLDSKARMDPAVPLPIIQGPKLLALGRLDFQKGFDVLLHAMQILRKERAWSLVVVGDGALETTLQALAGELGLTNSVHWLGNANNPFPYFQWADLVLVPSRWEGFPNVPLEAMALGRAVICSDCPTGPRELTEGGRYGRLVPVGDALALAGAILELGEKGEDRMGLGRAARIHVQANYIQVVVAGRYRTILHGEAQ